MIPVSDTVRSRTFPYVNITIILTCIAVFIYEITLATPDINRFFFDYGVVPGRLTDWLASPSGVREPLTLITATFVHGGWLHLIGNMLFLWVFGDNVEDALGHMRYLVFYLVCGALAAGAQIAVDTGSMVPMVGASGAIAGVLGAYLVLYPGATVGVVVPWLWFLGPLPVPAFVLIIFWFILQLFSGLASLGAEGVVQGVAFWAHIGGFAAGLLILLSIRRFIPKRSLSRPRPRRRRRNVDMW